MQSGWMITFVLGMVLQALTEEKDNEIWQSNQNEALMRKCKTRAWYLKFKTWTDLTMSLSHAPLHLRLTKTNSLMNWLRGCLKLMVNLENRISLQLMKREKSRRTTLWWHPTKMHVKHSAIRIIILAQQLSKTTTIRSITPLHQRPRANLMIRHPINHSIRPTCSRSNEEWKVCHLLSQAGETTKRISTLQVEKVGAIFLVCRYARKTISYINDS